MKYPLFKVFMADTAAQEVEKVLKSGYIGQGELVEEFERQFRKYIGADRDVITVNSATSALDLAMHMCGVDHESEVISTAITCFSARASVKLADGGSMPIGKIVKDKLNVEVLSYNLETKALEPKRVIGWVKLPSEGVEWFKLYCKNGRTSTSGVGKHHTWVTGDHKIYTNRGYVRVDELKDTDKVLTSYTVPNAKQMEVINGTLLGDSSINRARRFTSRLSFTHSIDQREWFNLKLNAFKGLQYALYDKPAYNQSKEALVFQTSMNSYWSVLHDKWYSHTGKNKTIPEDIELTPMTLATWYMDDGSLINDSVTLCTDSFDQTSLWNIFYKLVELGYKPTVRKAKSENQYRIYIGRQFGGVQRFFETIAPYIPPSMRYKLPNGFAEFDPELWNLGTAVVGTDDVVAERGYPPPHEDPAAVYCLEVEDNHNFVVANMVVSNCTATNSPAITRGAAIVWANVNENTGLIDEDSIGDLITPKTKCIIAVNWGGRKPDYNKLKAYGLPVVEDAAHGPYKLDGNNGDYVIWSFQAIKFLTTGDGGAILCPDPERARLLRWFGLDRRSSADFRAAQNIKEVGYKYHMNDISAAIGLENLKHLDRLVGQHKYNAYTYDKLLRGYPKPTYDSKSPYWIYTIFANKGILTHLKANGIHASPVHARNDAHDAFRKQSLCYDRLSVINYDAKQINIPVGWWLKYDDLYFIANAVWSYRPVELVR